VLRLEAGGNPPGGFPDNLQQVGQSQPQVFIPVEVFPREAGYFADRFSPLSAM
jgi:hypothetical protein